MLRLSNFIAPATVLLATLLMPSTWAQEAAFAQPWTVQSAAAQQIAPMPINTPAPAVGVPSQPGYVNLGAPLYSSPQPTVPVWAGGSMIPTPALAPHEMLYPHTYRAMYPPFYHRVKGHYVWTPFGMRTHENWQLQGTMVTVKYRSEYPVLKTFHPPIIHRNGPPWY